MDFVIHLRDADLLSENIFHTVDNHVLKVVAGKLGDGGRFIHIEERFLTNHHHLFA